MHLVVEYLLEKMGGKSVNINNAKDIKQYEALTSSNNISNKLNTTTAYKNSKKDTLELSSMSRPMLGAIDKGTAAETTLYVNYATFQNIANYTTNNPECQWEEMGIDDEKRWIVVNGQRFECPLTKEEKELRRRMRFTLLDYMEEHRMAKERLKPEPTEANKVTIDFSNGSASVSSDAHPKIKNLLANEKVMKMLKDISARGGSISVSPA